jgi:hypothetical protein
MGGSIVQLNDSTLGALTHSGATVVVSLRTAYLLKSEGVPGVDVSTRWSQAVDLTFQEAEILGDLPDLPAVIQAGRITINSVGYVDMLPVPLNSAGWIRLVLEFQGTGEPLTIIGTEIQLALQGLAKYLAHVPAA